MTTRVLTLLGEFALVRDGTPVTRFHSDKVRALLAYLATEADRSHARAMLAGLFWPEQAEAAALRNLTQTLVRLREVLGHSDADPAPLRSTWQIIQWQPDRATVDVTLFHQLAASAHTQDLARAAALYTGEFLSGFSLPGCEAFEEWLLLMREQFRQQALLVLHTLGERYFAAQQWSDAAGVARRAIELDRWREDAHRQLMRALLGAGDRAAALAAYQRCAQILRDDLDITPDDETMALADTIRTQESASATTHLQVSTPADVRPPVLRPSLPSAFAPLIGREDELTQVNALLRNDSTRLLTVMGVGGAGKTRLALAAAWTLRDAFDDGIGWVPLAGIAPSADPALQTDALAVAVGTALGLFFGGRAAPLDELCHVLEKRTLLLVLDNCEHLSVTAFIHHLLAAAPHVRVLATSRTRLDVSGEVLLRLDGLPVPEIATNQPQHYAGVQLFLAQAQRHVPHFGRDPDDIAAAARLCQLLDGLPLGIELAARWVGHYTCDEIADEMQADLDFLAVNGGDPTARHHSLRAAFDYSWVMLRENERQVLARLSVFRGTFDRAAAQAVAAMRVTTLATLVDASLLRHLGVGRYGFHEVVRQFASARLAELGETEALSERHATYYLDLVAQQEAALYGHAPQQGAAHIRDMADNVRQAWSWAVDHGLWGGIAHSLPAVRQYARLDGLFYEYAARVAAAAEKLDAQIANGEVAPEHAVLFGRLLGTKAYFLERQEARVAAAAAARAAIASASAAGDALGEAYAYLQLSSATVPYIAALVPHELLQALDWLERAIDLCRTVSEAAPRERRFATEVEAECLLKSSTIRIELREYSAAGALAEQGIALAQQNGDRMHEARALSVSAMALENAGRFEAAYERRVVMLDLARANDSRPQEHMALNNLSCTLIYLGDYSRALEYAQAAIRISGEWMQNPYQNADSYHTLSWAACRAGEVELALDAALRALVSAQATGIPHNQTLPLLALGDAFFAMQRYDEAYNAYTAALALGRERRIPPLISVARAGIARCQLANGATGEAYATVNELLRGPDMLIMGSLWEPMRVVEICYQVLQAVNDPRAIAVLHAAAAQLTEQANTITDHERRRIFLEHIAAHRALLAAVAHNNAFDLSEPHH